MIREKIISAIEKNQVMTIVYGGERVIEPHILYVSSNGNILLDAYQISGYSESNEPVAWKRFNIDEIKSAELVDETFTPRPDYNPNNSERYVTIIAKV